MNRQSNSASNNSGSYPGTQEGYIHLLSTASIFEMDLVGKNLKMNGIDALWFYPDPIEHPDDTSLLFVKNEQRDNALSILASLDLTDFTLVHGK